MKSAISLAQMRIGDVGVNLSSRNATMAKHVLDTSDVGAIN